MKTNNKNRFLAEEKYEIYHLLFESANDAILIISAGFVFIDCNKVASKMFGRPKREIIGLTPVDDSITPKFQSNGQLSSELGKEKFSLARQGKDIRFEWIHKKKNGTEFPVEISLFGFVASRKKNFFAILKDLTEMKRKEHELKESEERFRNIFTQSADGILILQPSKGFIDCNPAALKQLQYDRKEELIGKNPWEISPEFQPDGSRSREKAEIVMQRCLDEGNTNFEWVHLKKNGEPIFFDVVLTRIEFQKKEYFHCLLRDITKRKKDEELIKTALNEKTTL
jgi:PAS domain S-box-containing protein